MTSTLNPQHAPDSPSATAAPAEARTLRAFGPGGEREGTPVTTGFGDEVVVLAYAPNDPDVVEVLNATHAYTLPVNTPATELADPHRRADLLQHVMTQIVDRLQEALVDLACTRARHARTLEEIRRYAIDKHLDGEFCRDGLNAFLSAFGMAVHEPRTRIDYTITGSYEVDNEDVGWARDAAVRDLEPDLGSVDDVIDGTSTFTVEVTDTTTLDS